ncbi:MAG: four helix bundle protein [Candidatus Omnitrophica bacterium]|nr:four helix bundle protein [Candidatus Omnitrophota bacterium]
MAFMLEKLDVYNKAIDFYCQVSKLTKSFPKGNYHIIDQFNRAALSVSLNIAEGNGRYHLKERQSFFRIARGSAFECVPILEICKRENLVDAAVCQTLLQNLETICKMLSGLINKKQ